MNHRGFTLIEVMIAVAIFGLVIAGMAPAFAAHIRFNTESELRSNAIAAAQHTLDELRFEDVTSMPSSGSVGPTNVVVGDKTFQVVRTFCGTASYCTSNRIRHIRVEVSYRERVIYGIETVYTDLE